MVKFSYAGRGMCIALNREITQKYRVIPYRDSSVSERFAAFTYICLIYWLCIVIEHNDRE